MATDDKTYTQAEWDKLQKERDALAAKRDELLDEVKDAKREMRKIREDFTDLQQQQKAGKAGITAEELKQLRADVQADLEKQYGPVKVQAETLAAENRTLRLDNVVKGAMAKGGVLAERIDALFKLEREEFDLTDDGQPMLTNRKGTPVEKYVAEELKQKYPEWFQGSGSSGGGASKSSAGGGSVTSIAADDGKAFLSNLSGIIKGEVAVR